MTFLKLLILSSLTSFGSLPQSLFRDEVVDQGRQERIAKAGFATFASQVTSSFGRTGNPLQAFQAPFQKENLQALAINVVSAGLMEKFGPPSTKALLEAKKTPVFSDFVRYNGARSALNTGLTMVFTGKPLERALKDGGVQFIGNTLGDYGSYQIGQHYGPLNSDGTSKESGLSYGEHKLLHGVVGGLTGGILNASKSSKEIKQGVISGATGAMAAEIVGEHLLSLKDKAYLEKKTEDIVRAELTKTGEIPTTERFAEVLSKEVERSKELATLIGASLGAFVGKDANTAYWTSQNAVENNLQGLLTKNFLRPALEILAKKYGPTLGKEGVQKAGKVVKGATQLIKQAPSTTGGPGLEPENEPKKEGEEKEAERKIPVQTKSYIREIEKRTDTKISDTQKDHLAQDLRQNNYKKLEKPDYDAHARQFKGKKDDLIEQWEQNQGLRMIKV